MIKSFNSSKSTSRCLVVNVVVLPLKGQGFKIEILNVSVVYVCSTKNIKKWRNLIKFSKCLIFQASPVWPLP
jgi:hypothetical protein